MTIRGMDLQSGLVGGHVALYNNNATFHAQVKVMAEVLPVLVDLLADIAREDDERRAEMMKVKVSVPPRVRALPQEDLGGLFDR